jgi:hypothetical protein
MLVLLVSLHLHFVYQTNFIDSFSKVVAPTTLFVRDSTGKIEYPQTSVEASTFRLMQGRRKMRTYQIASVANELATAHTFCSECGVPICSAIDPDSDMLILNVNCLDSVWIRQEATDEKLASAPTTVTAETTSNLYSTPTKESRSASLVNSKFADEKKTASDHSPWSLHFASPTTKTNYMNTLTNGLLACVNPRSPPATSIELKTDSWPTDSVTESTSTSDMTSMASSSFDTNPSIGVDREQLRRFMSKYSTADA